MWFAAYHLQLRVPSALSVSEIDVIAILGLPIASRDWFRRWRARNRRGGLSEFWRPGRGSGRVLLSSRCSVRRLCYLARPGVIWHVAATQTRQTTPGQYSNLLHVQQFHTVSLSEYERVYSDQRAQQLGGAPALPPLAPQGAAARGATAARVPARYGWSPR